MERPWPQVVKQFQAFGIEMVYTDAYTFYRLEHELAFYLGIKSPHWEETKFEGVLTENLHSWTTFQQH